MFWANEVLGVQERPPIKHESGIVKTNSQSISGFVPSEYGI